MPRKVFGVLETFLEAAVLRRTFEWSLVRLQVNIQVTMPRERLLTLVALVGRGIRRGSDLRRLDHRAPGCCGVLLIKAFIMYVVFEGVT